MPSPAPNNGDTFFEPVRAGLPTRATLGSMSGTGGFDAQRDAERDAEQASRNGLDIPPFHKHKETVL